MNIIEYQDLDMLAMDVATVLADEIKALLHTQDRVTIALPGGSTPAPVYQNLCGVHMDWDRVDVVLTDERWVPEDDPRSNTAMLRQNLLTDQAAAARYHPLYAKGDQAEVLTKIRQDLGPILPIDILVLGMGADMHTASMFPNSPQLDETLELTAPIVLPVSVPDQPDRVTLTMETLKSAGACHILISGADKRAAITQAHKLADPRQAPIAPFTSNAQIHWTP